MIGMRLFKATQFWGAAFCTALALVACSGESSNEPDTEPAAETVVEAVVEATEETVAETAVDPLAIGDPQAGEELFNDQIRLQCSGCHTLDGKTHRPGPTLLGISAAAGERVAGLSAEEYVRQSIVDPEAYILEGFEDTDKPMPVVTVTGPDAAGAMRQHTVTDEELNNLIAFVLTH